MPQDTPDVTIDSHPCILPLELEILIFGLAATSPDDVGDPPLHLLLVCKRIYSQLKPLLYRTLLACESVNLSAMPKVACIYVETLIIDVNESVDDYAAYAHIRAILKECCNLRALRLVSFTLFGASSHLSDTVNLQHLSMAGVWSTKKKNFMLPQLSTLTHLYMSSGVDRGSLVTFIEAHKNFRRLTHLAISLNDLNDEVVRAIMPIVDRILIKFHSIQYLVIHRVDDGKTIQAQMSFDKRLIYIHDYWGGVVDENGNWMAGLCHHQLDRWEIAEGIREARDGNYFKDRSASLSWITSSRQGFQELLHDWGMIKLARRSLLWSRFLGIEWRRDM